MSEFKCLVCQGTHFRQGYYDVDIYINIYPHVYNAVNTGYSCDCDIDVRTDIDNEISSSGEIDFRIKSEEKDKYVGIDEFSKIYKYICEDCGFVMSFIKEKEVESRNQERKRKEKENTFDWSSFGK